MMRATVIALVVAEFINPVFQVAIAADPIDAPGAIASEFIFSNAPFAECHASTIAETPSGLVAAWFGGTKEKHPDVCIWLSRQVDGAWTPPTEVANGIQYRRLDGSVHRYACWNPVLFQVRTSDPNRPGKLLLFYKCGPEPRAWWGMLMTSRDNGATWSEPKRLPEGILGPVKNKPVQLADGKIVCPSSTEDNGWRLHLEQTRDFGRTWSRSGPLNDGVEIGAIQPSLLIHPDGRWQLLARDRRRVGNVWTAWSNDSGQTWSKLISTELPNPSSGTDAVTLRDGRQLIVYNHTQRPSEEAPIGNSRGTLNVALSDDGTSWQAALVLEHGDGEFSYPAVIQTDDGLIHITYTWNRKRIKHVVIDPANLTLTPIEQGEWPEATN